MRRPALAAIALVLAGCGRAPVPTPQPAVTGFVEVTVDVAPDSTQYFASQHRARVIDGDAAILKDWQITDAPSAVPVPTGTLRLEAFTVFLGDFLECPSDPASPGTSRCVQPTLEPAQVCTIPIEVVAGETVHARFRSLPEGGCELGGIAEAVGPARRSPGSSRPASGTATFFLTATGYPPGSIAYGGFKLEATLLRDDRAVADWDPWRQNAVRVAPGAYLLVLGGVPYSDVTRCATEPAPTCVRDSDQGPAGPHQEVCRMPIEIEPDRDRQVFVDLAAGGPTCATYDAPWPPTT